MVELHIYCQGASEKRCQARDLKDPVLGTRRKKEQREIVSCAQIKS
jgi:hypothetical protein